MKRIFISVLLLTVMLSVSCIGVNADTLDDLSSASGANSLIDELPDDVNSALSDIGVEGSDLSTVQNISFSSTLEYIISVAGQQAGEILPSVSLVLAVLLLFSIFVGVFDAVTSPALSTVLSVISSLCIACVLLFPVTSLIETAKDAINVSANFMLAFIPVMTAVLVSAGQGVLGSGYSAMMVVAAEGVAQFFAKIITPMLSCLLSLGVSSSIVPEIKLSGVLNSFSKTVKWMLSFVFTIFTALLTLKSLYSSSIDNVSSRAVRYTMSSFIPVVGGALSEAYRTVHGSVGVLKSGIGVFVIIAVVTVFLPVITRLLLWLLTVNICKSFAEITSLQSPQLMLSSVSSVLSVLLSVIFCIIALFIITTALIITIGGSP